MGTLKPENGVGVAVALEDVAVKRDVILGGRWSVGERVPGVNIVFDARHLKVFDPDIVSTVVPVSPAIVITAGVVWEIPAEMGDVLDTEGPDKEEVLDRDGLRGREEVLAVDGVLLSRELVVVAAAVIDPVAAQEADRDVAMPLGIAVGARDPFEVSPAPVESTGESDRMEKITVGVPKTAVVMLATMAVSVLCPDVSGVDVDEPELPEAENFGTTVVVISEVLPDTTVVRTEVKNIGDRTVIRGAVKEDVTVRTDPDDDVVKTETLTALVDTPRGWAVSVPVPTPLLLIVGIASVRDVSE